MNAILKSSDNLSGTQVANNIIASSERKIWPLIGGVHPEENKLQSTGRPIGSPALPKMLVLPLSQHAGTPADPVVTVGEKVLKGQIIAKASGFVSAALHAPSSGIITAIENRPIPHVSGFYDLCIILETDGEDQWCELRSIADYRQLSPESLVEKVRDAGISGMGGAGFPTAIKLVPSSTINTLILNGTECEPYITADDMLMREKAEAVIQGAEILQYMLNAQECLIGIEDNKPEAISAMRAALLKTANDKNIDIVVFPTIYPSGGEKQLIQILTGQEVPSGKLPADLGMVVQNVGTAVAVKEAILEGKPLISRITTLTGDALKEPQNVEVLIGTLAEDLLQHAVLKEPELSTLVFGGPMMGFSVDRLDIPVIKTSNCLIAATQEEFPEAPDAQACIRCGHCAEACPSSLLPQQLYWHAKAENHEQLMHHNLFDCIECGACSFVCPSSIPLVQYYRASKGAIRTQEAKHAKSERSKERYENRLARLEQDKAEKEAKRKANAERAAKLKAAKAAEKPESDSKAEEDPIQAAIARAKARKAAAAAGQAATDSKPVRAELSARQKELKVQLSMAKAQAKKTERALAAAEASGNEGIEQLKSNLNMLNEQVSKLQQEFDQSSQPASVNESNRETSAKKARPVLSDDEKKRKVELAMAKAALKKAERALAEAIESSNENTESLKQAVEECQAKVKSLEVTVAEVATRPLANKEPSSDEKPSAKKAKTPLSDEAKKLKIEAAMANAAVKKLQRTIASASEDELDTLKQQLTEAEDKAAELKQALDTHINSEVTPPTEAATKPLANEETSAGEKPSADVKLPAKKAKAPLNDEAKKLKIEAAMANAAVKKLQRTIANAGENELETLKQQLAEAEQKAAQMKQALEALS